MRTDFSMVLAAGLLAASACSRSSDRETQSPESTQTPTMTGQEGMGTMPPDQAAGWESTPGSGGDTGYGTGTPGSEMPEPGPGAPGTGGAMQGPDSEMPGGMQGPGGMQRSTPMQTGGNGGGGTGGGGTGGGRM